MAKKEIGLKRLRETCYRHVATQLYKVKLNPLVAAFILQVASLNTHSSKVSVLLTDLRSHQVWNRLVINGVDSTKTSKIYFANNSVPNLQ